MVRGGKSRGMKEFEVVVGGGEWEDAVEMERFRAILKDMR